MPGGEQPRDSAPPLPKSNSSLRSSQILDKIKDLTMTGKKECSLILGLVGSNTCSCQIIDSTNGSREVLHYVALGSGGPFATAYLDSVLTGAEKKVNMSVEEGVGVAVRGVLKGVECDEFSGGRVEVVIMRKGGKVERWRFTPGEKRVVYRRLLLHHHFLTPLARHSGETHSTTNAGRKRRR